jgi:hypothetical protein
MARSTTVPELLPGLCDGPLASFFSLLGPLLARGAAPEEVVPALGGILRIPPGGGEADVEEEWQVARQVLHAYCQSLGVGKAVESWLDAAVSAAQSAAIRAARGEAGALPRVVPVRVYAGLALRPRG